MSMRFRKDLPDSGGANYVKLKNGESISGIFYGDIHEFWAIWRDGKPGEVPEGTPGAGFRFRVNFIVKEGAVYVPKILEQGKTVYQDLGALHEEYNLEETVVKITRHGSSMNDTAYMILPLKQELSAEAKAHLKTLKLNDLSGKPKSSGDNDRPFSPDDEEIPF